MSETTGGLSWEQHAALGAELRQLEARLRAVAGGLDQGYSPGGAAGREARRAAEAITRMRGHLALLAAHDFPDRPADAARQLYYDPAELARLDAAAGRRPGTSLPVDETTAILDEDRRWGGEGG